MKNLIICFVFIFTVIGCTDNKSKKEELSGELTVFYAGSLAVPIQKICDSFSKIYPQVKFHTESAGSRVCCRKIVDLNRKCDIIAVADYIVIEDLLYPEYCDNNYLFAGNEMTIVYTDKSKYSDKINQTNWKDILMREDVKFGRSDPEADPCGYRTMMTLQLAGKYYKEDKLYNKFLQKDLKYIRPQEVDLLALLETGAIDYIFIYKSVGLQHGLKILNLPDSINLKKEELKNLYETATVTLIGKEKDNTVIYRGEPMIYSIAIPKCCTDTFLANKFLKFFLDPSSGMKIMEECGQPSIKPYKSLH